MRTHNAITTTMTTRPKTVRYNGGLPSSNTWNKRKDAPSQIGIMIMRDRMEAMRSEFMGPLRLNCFRLGIQAGQGGSRAIGGREQEETEETEGVFLSYLCLLYFLLFFLSACPTRDAALQSLLRQQRFDDLPMHVGEAVVAALEAGGQF